MSLIDSTARERIVAYDRSLAGARYNKIANAVYGARVREDPLSPLSEPAILDGLWDLAWGGRSRAAVQP